MSVYPWLYGGYFMSDISKLDKNFKVETSIEREGLRFFNVLDEPFKIYGLIRENDEWVRMPGAVAKEVSEGVYGLYRHTAGGRVRFVTDSPYIVIKAETKGAYMMPHIPQTGLGGFDLYRITDTGERYVKTFIPKVPAEPSLEFVIDVCNFVGKGEFGYTINFPLYCPVQQLYIGLKEGCTLKQAPGYALEAPIVYYGSSITQGGCASRPGNSYQAMLTRHFNLDHVNLGFSGNGKGEPVMADYIASLDMCAFVYDYDHNAPSIEHLRETHKPLFDKVRAAHPDIPIIMMSRPNLYVPVDARTDVIRDTYNAAVAAGDKNVYFIHGMELLEMCNGDGTVDGTHPNDLGFFSMYTRIAKELEKAFNKK